MASIFLIFINPIIVMLISPMMIGVIRKGKAFMQNRHGASIFQPYRDLIKLFHKDEIITEDASWIFRAAPYIVFGSTLALATGIPFLSAYFTFVPLADLLVFVYLIALGTFFLALAGIDTGGGFGGFGAAREMMLAAVIEGGFILSLFSVALIAGTTNFVGMADAVSGIGHMHILPLILAAVAFGIALLSENARMPVDNPATHLELTMVHEAMILEYSGKRLALMEWAAANKLVIFSALLTSIFFPWGLAWEMTPVAVAVATATFLGKILCVALVIAFIESTIPKFRIFRVPDMLFTSFVLSLIAVLVITLS